ncbi:MAG: pyruvate oxidase [Deltaproteobacteria bacterium]|nr:pyruvate oxidase [Deltaproteobacteria bacterium]
MATTAADVMIETLIDWGVDTIFGLPGDGINGIMEALRKNEKRIRFIHVRHEEAAAFMACGYAKFTGRLGVCLATSGPGGIHLLNGLYDAKLDGAPVLAITGMQFHDLTNTHGQQDVELDKLFEDVAVYNTRIMGPAHVENATELACRTALAYRAVAHITIPVDFQSMPVTRDSRSERNIAHHASNVFARSARLPGQADLERAADVLNEGRKIVILAGQGALDATDELLELAELLGGPIVKPLLGKAAVPDDSIYTTGGIGLLGTRPSAEALETCDTILLVGTSFPYIDYLPKPGQARAVQIDIDSARISLRYPVQVGLVGDSKKTLRALLPLLNRNDHRDFLRKAQDGMREWWRIMKDQGTRTTLPMKPQVVAWELGKRLRNDAIVSCDSGTIATWWARHIPARRGQMHSLSGTLATMAPGLPYAIAAAVAYPGRQSVAFVGDGGLSMLMAEFSTAVKYRLPVKVVVIDNNTLGQIKWEQIAMLGNPEYGCELEPIDYGMFAQACGGKGFYIDDPADCGRVLDQALEAPGPVIVHARVDALEPPLPGKIKPDQALKFAQSLLRGERDREKIISTLVRDKVKELF